VMDEQDAQWAKGEDDFDRLAVLSQNVSKTSVALALLRAEEDEVIAWRIYTSGCKSKISEVKEKFRSRTLKNVAKPSIIIVHDDTYLPAQI